MRSSEGFGLSGERSGIARISLEGRQWIYRGVAATVTALLLWLTYSVRNKGVATFLLTPLIMGTFVAALRFPGTSGFINLADKWLIERYSNAKTSNGKFSRFVARTFFGMCLTIWRRTEAVADPHLRAGLRLTTVVFISAATLSFVAMAVYLLVIVAVIVIGIAIALWALSLWAGTGSRGPRTVITRQPTDWIGQPRQEHFDVSGRKVGESRETRDWLGQPKTVHSDARGRVVGESRLTTDWMGDPKTVHRDTGGNVIGESRPDSDWMGAPKTVHRDAQGNVIGESREETNILGRSQTVRYEKTSQP